MNCVKCPDRKCHSEGKNCLGASVKDIAGLYNEEELGYMQAAGCTEADNYMQMTRLEESAYYASKLGLKRLGVAFCVGLLKEAALVVKYFEKEGFQIESLCCKVCGIDKDEFDLVKIRKGLRESMCNPKMQAKVLNDAGTELNFTVGLCVGHDVLFGLGSKAPVCCLVAKDRILAHNTVGALTSFYWRKKLGID